MVNPLSDLDYFHKLSLSKDWIQSGQKALGMYYEIDSSIIETFKIDDGRFSIKLDEGGLIVVEIFPTIQIKDLEHLNLLFFQMWSQISFNYGFVKREVSIDSISYKFITGGDLVGYEGFIIFRGSFIEEILIGIGSD